MSLNITIFQWLHSLAGLNPVLDSVIIFIADSLDSVLLVFIVIFLLMDFHEKTDDPEESVGTWAKEMLIVGTVSFLSWAAADLVFKGFFAIPRPYETLETVQALFQYGSMDSYPSGHAAFFAGLAISLMFVHRRVGLTMTVFAALIPIARVIAGVHFPFDIIGGWILGGAVAFSIFGLYSLLKRPSIDPNISGRSQNYPDTLQRLSINLDVFPHPQNESEQTGHFKKGPNAFNVS